MKTGLQKLLAPKSIAVIGGGNWCRNVTLQSRRFGFRGPIWPVHPSREEMAGEHCFKSVADLPAAPDASFIGVNRHATIDVVKALSTKRAGGAVCFASGFLEAQSEANNGVELQRQLLDAAGDMTVLGPNCYGFINYLDGALLWPDQQGGAKVTRGVAIVTQSSNIAINITMQRRGLPISYVVTVGNQAQTGLADIGSVLLQDERVSALGLHIEGVGDIRALETLATLAGELGKPVVALKVGRSDQARSATISHTASLAGSDAGANALLERLAIARCDTLAGFLETLKLLHVTGPLDSGRLVSLSCSGGEASLMADLAVPTALTFPALNQTQENRLRSALGPMVKLANPLDYHTYIWNDAAAMADAFCAAMDPSIALGIVVSDFPRVDRCDPSDWDSVISAVETAQQRSGRPMAIVSSLPENMPEDVATDLVARGIAPLCGMSDALCAIAAAVRATHPPARTPLLLPRPAKASRTLSEADAKSALAKFGLICPKGKDISGAEGFAQACDNLAYPLVLKGLGIVHKSDAGAVRLNLKSIGEVEEAAGSIPANSFLVEEMVSETLAEVLIGVVLDPAHGYVLTLGAGGVFTEALNDTTSLLIPTTSDAIETALKRLKSYPLLNGFRGRPRADTAAIIDAALAIQAYVIANHGRVEEVEINPLLVLASGAIAADALIRTGD